MPRGWNTCLTCVSEVVQSLRVLAGLPDAAAVGSDAGGPAVWPVAADEAGDCSRDCRAAPPAAAAAAAALFALMALIPRRTNTFQTQDYVSVEATV